MTVLAVDRIDMAGIDEQHLDELFEQTSVPAGYKVEIVGGGIHMAPQRDTHWEITIRIYEQLRTKYPVSRIKSDVRIDYPGLLNAFCSDLTLIADKAEKSPTGRWHHHDVEFVAEVISRSTGQNDYGPKKRAYATAVVPVYLIADPYQRKCHLYTDPENGDYRTETTVTFGTDVDLTKTPLGLTLKTDEFPTD